MIVDLTPTALERTADESIVVKAKKRRKRTVKAMSNEDIHWDGIAEDALALHETKWKHWQKEHLRFCKDFPLGGECCPQCHGDDNLLWFDRGLDSSYLCCNKALANHETLGIKGRHLVDWHLRKSKNREL